MSTTTEAPSAGVQPIDITGLNKDEALHLYKEMLRIRRFEDRVYQLFLKGELPGTLHQYQGQEAVAVGACQALAKEDWITSTHRPHGHALAKGVTVRGAMAELYGKATGCCFGKGGSMHLGDPDVGMVPAIAIVAGGISVVSGMGLAFKMQGEGKVALCFFGEGASNEGAFHEGLNFAAVQKLPIVYLCENNIYGASTPFHKTSLVPNVADRVAGYGIPSVIVDGMDVVAVQKAVTEARERALRGEGPTLIEAKTYRFAGHSRGDARGYRTKDEEAVWKDRDAIERLGLSITSTGLGTADDLAQVLVEVNEELEDAVEFSRNSPDCDPAEAFTDAYANPIVIGNGSVPPAPVQPAGDRKLTITEAIREAIAEEMERDPKLFLIGEDVGIPGGFGGAFGVYLGLPEKFGHDRIIDTPISEKAIAGAAVGAAMMGMNPLPDMQYSDFLFECMDELVNQAAKMRYMSGGKLSVPLVMRAPVGTANRGAQHGQCPESYFIHVPGLKVVAPSDAFVAKGLIKAAIRDGDPVLVFEHKLLYGSKGREQAGGLDLTTHVPTEDYIWPIGRARVLREGTDATVVATHLTLYRALAAADELAAEGFSIEVIDPISLQPFDTETIFASVEKTGRLLIAHEDTTTGGWGGELAARVAEERLFSLEAPIKRVAAHDIPLPVAPILEQTIVPTQERIKNELRALLG